MSAAVNINQSPCQRPPPHGRLPSAFTGGDGPMAGASFSFERAPERNAFCGLKPQSVCHLSSCPCPRLTAGCHPPSPAVAGPWRGRRSPSSAPLRGTNAFCGLKPQSVSPLIMSVPPPHGRLPSAFTGGGGPVAGASFCFERAPERNVFCGLKPQSVSPLIMSVPPPHGRPASVFTGGGGPVAGASFSFERAPERNAFCRLKRRGAAGRPPAAARLASNLAICRFWTLDLRCSSTKS